MVYTWQMTTIPISTWSDRISLPGDKEPYGFPQGTTWVYHRILILVNTSSFTAPPAGRPSPPALAQRCGSALRLPVSLQSHPSSQSTNLVLHNQCENAFSRERHGDLPNGVDPRHHCFKIDQAPGYKGLILQEPRDRSMRQLTSIRRSSASASMNGTDVRAWRAQGRLSRWEGLDTGI